MSKSINVPKLRFKEFSGEWVNTKLGNLGNFQGGGTPATSEDKYWIGNIPWISSSDIICKISDNVSTCFTFMFPFFQTSFKSVKL